MAFMISPGSRIAHFLDDSTYGLAVGDIFLADRQIDIIARHRIIFLLKQQSIAQLWQSAEKSGTCFDKLSMIGFFAMT